MRILIKNSCLLLFLGLALNISAQPKWTSLFDGQTLEGWKQLNGKAKFEVVDGAIVGTTVPGEPNSFLVTNLDYGDFILELEIKVGEMNSGIQIRSHSIPEYKNGKVHGYQVEIDPSDRGWSGGIFDEGRRGWLYQNEINPKAKKAFKKGEWNKYRIEAIGSVIRTWVNGMPVSYLVDDMDSKGFIALQVHSIKDGKGGAQVSWRNIHIQTGPDIQLSPNDETPVINYMLNTLSSQEKAQGFELLFNGKDLIGWRSAHKTTPPQKGWMVENGILQVLAADEEKSRVGGDIITQKKYKAFELSFDFKLTEGANSGIKYFVDESYRPGGPAIGLEYQILDDAKHPDAKLGVEGNRTLASLYDLIPSDKISKRFTSKIGEWNRGRVIVLPDNRVEHWLNGFKVVEYTRGSKIYKVLVARSKYGKWENFGMADEGHILLQDHGNSVYFKNVKIRELK